jgi:TolB-like protein/tRNA A-37 threonylcarbamoyl transferase component Bud32/Flp pilus assembly protein TadD
VVDDDTGTRIGFSPLGDDSAVGRVRVFGMTLDMGTKLGPYELTGALGSGGMGEVYKARDSKLQRDVAIKVLPEAVASDERAYTRFEREAHAVAALSHPNILSIFDFGRDGRLAYAVMELLEGLTLRQKLAQGTLPPKVAIDYAMQIAKGLAAAHEKGIVHRDLKPENVFVTRDGHIKILDFGLAKRVETDDEGQTQAGMVMGTVGYMSPEQVRGKDVDRRSDIFSFGAVLYEMLTRKRAFKKGSNVETMEAILNDEPRELSGSGGIPPALAVLVKRCLEKSPERRFESAHDLTIALEELWVPVSTATYASYRRRLRVRRVAYAGGVALLAAVASLAAWRIASRRPGRPRWTAESGRPARLVVLPFDNQGAPEDAYFASGVTDEISGRLGSVKGLTVISRTTANAYDRKGKTIGQIGKDLDVDYVLEGSVRWEHAPGSKGRVRVSPQLIQVADDAEIWSDRYDRFTADVFAIQSEVGENVAKAAGVKLAPAEKAALASAATKDMQAYDLYLRALAASGRQTKKDQEEALQLAQSAVEKDPSYAQALALLAKTHLFIYFLHFDHSKEHVDRAKDIVDKLTALGPDLPETHVARAYLTYWGLSDYPRALEEFKAVLALQPSNADALIGLGYVSRRLGRWEEAAEEMGRLVKLDPRNSLTLIQYGYTCLLLRRYADADATWRKAVEIFPGSGTPWGRGAWLQVVWKGDVEKAKEIVDQGSRVAGLLDDQDWIGWARFRVALARRDFAGALSGLDQEKESAISNNFVYIPIELMRGQALDLMGRKEAARRSYEAARTDLEERSRQEPEDSRYQGSLALACAGLGLKEEALRAANRGIELMPMAKDSWAGPWRIEELALVETMLGAKADAVERVGFLLSHTGEISANVLRLDPRWDPLRDEPGFQALVARAN